MVSICLPLWLLLDDNDDPTFMAFLVSSDASISAVRQVCELYRMFFLILAVPNDGAFLAFTKDQTGKVVCIKTWEQHTCLLR
jgi:hypothetical protein